MKELETMGQRIRSLRKSKKLTQAQLAKIAGVSSPAVTEWEKDGYSPKSESLEAMAVYFGVTTSYLIRGVTDGGAQSSSNEDSNKPQHMNFVPPVDLTHSENPRQTPVLSWVQAGDFSYVLSSDLSSAIDWIPYDPRAGKNGFALIVKGTSMEPDFKPDEFIYINPTYQIDELNTGALVVMACEGDSEATFKKLISEDGNYYLQPLNPNWKPQLIPLDHTCRLVGKVVGKYTRY